MRFNKLLKKFEAVGLAGIMTAVMALPAMAATADSSVSVTGITDGDSAVFYQVVAADSTATSGWKLANGFTSLTLGNLLDGTIDATDAQAIVAAAKNATEVSTQTSGYSYATDTDAKAGLYLVLVTPASGNTTTLYNPVFVSADYDSSNSTNTIDISTATGTYNSSEAKKQTPTVTKALTDSAQKDVNVGDTVSFKVTTKIPAMSTYTKPVFEVSDAVSNGLEIQTDGITLTAPTGLEANKEYTLTSSETGYTFAFKSDYLKGLTAGVNVTITYSAKVTSAATYNVNEMTNTASIKYSNNPTDETGNGTDDDKTYHYTFSLDASILGQKDKYNEELIKVAVDSQGNAITDYKKTHNGTERAALKGATFALYTAYTSDTENTPYTQDSTAVTATSNEYGDLSFTGLDAGTYYLKETAVPSGFVLNKTVYTVTITASYNQDGTLASYTVLVSDGSNSTTSTYTISNAGTTSVTSSDGDAATSIKNVKAVGLPSTGGMGTTIFYMVGAVLVIGAGVAMITRRRMEVQ